MGKDLMPCLRASTVESIAWLSAIRTGKANRNAWPMQYDLIKPEFVLGRLSIICIEKLQREASILSSLDTCHI